MKCMFHITSPERQLLRRLVEKLMDTERPYVFLGWSCPDEGLLIEKDAYQSLLLECPDLREQLLFRVTVDSTQQQVPFTGRQTLFP